MILIPPIAWLSGLTASMMFMVLGWPLANALSFVRVIFDSFQMKLLLVATLGAASAPIAEHHAPALQKVVDRLGEETNKLPDYLNNLSDQFS